MLKYNMRMRGDFKDGNLKDYFRKVSEDDPNVEDSAILSVEEMKNSEFYPIFSWFFSFDELDKDAYLEFHWNGLHTCVEVIEVEE